MDAAQRNILFAAMMSLHHHRCAIQIGAACAVLIMRVHLVRLAVTMDARGLVGTVVLLGIGAMKAIAVVVAAAFQATLNVARTATIANTVKGTAARTATIAASRMAYRKCRPQA